MDNIDISIYIHDRNPDTGYNQDPFYWTYYLCIQRKS
jgi:hypothetical protein